MSTPSTHAIDDKPQIDHDELKQLDTVVDDTEAAGYTDSTLVISPEENRRLRNKALRRILPLLMLAYLCQALDKSTIGTASIMGWIENVNTDTNHYGLTSTLHWVGLIAGEPLCNQLVRYLPLGKLMGVAVILWSALLMGLAFSLHIKVVFGLRVVLGFCEAIVGPGLLALTVQWFTTSEQPTIGAAWQSMLGGNGIISSLLGYGFYHLKNKPQGLYGWQWMSITIALFSFACGFIILIFLPDSPTKARWASEEDKVKFVERVRGNNQSLKQKVFKKEQAWEAAKDPFTYCLFLLAFSQTLIVGGINVFAGLLLNRAFGFSVLESQLLGIPGACLGIITYYLMAFFIKLTGETCLMMCAFAIPNIIGSIVVLIVTPSGHTRGGLLVAWYMMQFFQACNPAIFAMLSRNSAGQTKRSITYAVTYIGWAGGNAIAPQIFQKRWAPRYKTSLKIHFGLYAWFIIVCLSTRTLLARRNKQRKAALKDADGTVRNDHNLAFSDLTDLENPEFIYSL
ncbi:putative transporter [Vanrija pseudolonga]|uniref:Purtative transporter n=1 Tax=Vanrija pseudolonga TaxID=143232 RepID=A0AAF0Y3P5_9TREE|nr:purtative transporter [Vanrija pseudolonga]